MSVWQKRYLYFFVFITGAAIMSIEIAASRLLAPYFGNSMFVWAIIITIIMIGLALGYWWGGKIADRFPNERGLFLCALVAGVFTNIIPLISQFVFKLVERGIFATPVGAIILTFFLSCLLFLPAVILLGFMSPYVTRIILDRVSHSGNVTGNVYAISTIGSIFGILVTTFLTIPFLGTRETILLFSVLVILMGSLGLRKWYYFLVLILPILVYFSTQNSIKESENVLFENDTLYQYVQVIEDDWVRYIKFNEGGGIQSFFDFSKGISGVYYDYFIFLPDFVHSRKQNIVVIGFAGGVIAKELNLYKAQDYNLLIDGVEIDPEVANLAKKYFDLDDSDAKIHIADGRVYLNQTKTTYDQIIIDAYSREMYIPYHLATLEFFQLAKVKLSKDGIVSMNINAISDNSPILESITKTIGQIFGNVYINHIPESGNYLVFASDSEIDFSQLKIGKNYPVELITAKENLVKNNRKINIDNLDQIILTDNRAPSEYLTDHLFFEYLREN